MKILGLESSCDETSSAVVEYDGKSMHILSNVVASQIEIHALYGGVVPEIASRAHTEALSKITYEALEKAGCTMEDITAVAVTTHPGLIGALLCGVNFAKSLAFSHQKPLIGVDHIKGHMAAAYLLENPPKPPFIGLVTSGGHTAIYKVNTETTYEVIGTTRDDAIGESFDKIGRLIGIPYPSGAGFDKMARRGFARLNSQDVDDDVTVFEKQKKKTPYLLPTPSIKGDVLEFSFSGLKTAAMNVLHHCEQVGEELDKELFAASYTYMAVTAISEKIEMALKKYPGENLVLAGGVAANSHLRNRLATIAKKLGREIYIPSLSLCGDNGAMIAAQGVYEYIANHIADTHLNASAMDD